MNPLPVDFEKMVERIVRQDVDRAEAEAMVLETLRQPLSPAQTQDVEDLMRDQGWDRVEAITWVLETTIDIVGGPPWQMGSSETKPKQ